MAPFSYLINKHGDDLAILWIDSHPDMGTGETAFARARWRVPPHAGPNFLVPTARRLAIRFEAAQQRVTRLSFGS